MVQARGVRSVRHSRRALLALAGQWLSLLGGADWCPFQGIPGTLTKVIGGGLIVGAILLFAAGRRR
jgi:hypothetical protein